MKSGGGGGVWSRGGRVESGGGGYFGKGVQSIEFVLFFAG